MKKNMLYVAAMAAIVLAAGVLTSAGNKQKRLFMVGDSTMADKTELDISPERGWGQLFPSYLKDGIILENHAMNGRSTKSFQTDGRWDSVMGRMHRGDIVILQFGHNDAKREDPVRYASIEDYENNLVKMATEAQKKGATVIIATPINRRSFNKETGEFYCKHGGYPDAARRAAKRVGAPLLDLEAATADWLRGLGDEESKKYFMNVPAGECQKFPEGKIDNTHLRENGAMAVGKMAAQLIVDQKIKPLCNYINLNPEKPVYSTFCRPSFKTDKKKTESDMKTNM